MRSYSQLHTFCYAPIHSNRDKSAAGGSLSHDLEITHNMSACSFSYEVLQCAEKDTRQAIGQWNDISPEVRKSQVLKNE